MSRLSLTFKVPPKEVEDVILGELSVLLGKFAKAVNKRLPSITSSFKQLTRDVFVQGPMNQGLIGNDVTGDGNLAGQFGIPSSEQFSTADKIIDIIANNVFVDFDSKLEARQLSGRLTIQISSKVYDDLVSADFAEIKTKKGDILPWINWTFTKGDSIVIEDYEVFSRIGSGRSGFAIMIKPLNTSTFWKVPSEVSGTAFDNWITREIAKQRDEYLKLTQTTLNQIFSSIL